MDKNVSNREYYFKLYKDIIKTDDGYSLQNIYEEDENEKIRETSDSKSNPNKNQFSKNCHRCTYSYNEHCLLRTKLEKCSKDHYIPCHWTGNCDAYSPVFPLNIIKSENEMIEFVEKTEHFFRCTEDYEDYFGFERKWDEETGDILETIREYYDRGGIFVNIPNKFPCVIYFGVVDFDGERIRDEKLDWIYIGDV